VTQNLDLILRHPLWDLWRFFFFFLLDFWVSLFPVFVRYCPLRPCQRGVISVAPLAAVFGAFHQPFRKLVAGGVRRYHFFPFTSFSVTSVMCNFPFFEGPIRVFVTIGTRVFFFGNFPFLVVTSPLSGSLMVRCFPSVRRCPPPVSWFRRKQFVWGVSVVRRSGGGVPGGGSGLGGGGVGGDLV